MICWLLSLFVALIDAQCASGSVDLTKEIDAVTQNCRFLIDGLTNESCAQSQCLTSRTSYECLFGWSNTVTIAEVHAYVVESLVVDVRLFNTRSLFSSTVKAGTR
jgi:hypothetical protein